MALAAFGFEEVDVNFTGADGSPSMGAGSHPFALTTALRLNTVEDSGLESPDGDLKDLKVRYPAGLVVSSTAVPLCSATDFNAGTCSDSSAVGIAEVTASASGPIAAGSEDFADPFPVYNLVRSDRAVAKIGFVAAGEPIEAELRLSDAPPHNGVVVVSDLSQEALFYSVRISVWGIPAAPAHDSDRGQCAVSTGSCASAVPPLPFLTIPRSCTGSIETDFEAGSWQDPGQWVAANALTHDDAEPPNPLGLTGCGNLAFSPQVDAQPTTNLADTPSGFDLSIDVEDEGLVEPSGLAQSEIEKLVLTLPEGMIVNGEVAEGLATCTPAQYEQETLGSDPGDGCPLGSEIGTLEVETPLLPGEVLAGKLFAAEGDPALYVVIRHAELGILVKQSGELAIDPISEQLTVTFNDLPQLPFSHLGLHLTDGDDGPILTPPECGEFAVSAAMSPWSEPGSSLIATSPFEIVAGPAGGSCPSAEEPSGEEPPVGPGDGNPAPPSANPPAANPAPPILNRANLAKKRHRCHKGKRRVRGKGRCVRRRCRPAQGGRKTARHCGRRPHGQRPR